MKGHLNRKSLSGKAPIYGLQHIASGSWRTFKLYCSDVLRKKAKRYCVNLALKMAVYTVTGVTECSSEPEEDNVSSAGRPQSRVQCTQSRATSTSRPTVGSCSERTRVTSFTDCLGCQVDVEMSAQRLPKNSPKVAQLAGSLLLRTHCNQQFNTDASANYRQKHYTHETNYSQ